MAHKPVLDQTWFTSQSTPSQTSQFHVSVYAVTDLSVSRLSLPRHSVYAVTDLSVSRLSLRRHTPLSFTSQSTPSLSLRRHRPLSFTSQSTPSQTSQFYSCFQSRHNLHSSLLFRYLISYNTNDATLRYGHKSSVVSGNMLPPTDV